MHGLWKYHEQKNAAKNCSFNNNKSLENIEIHRYREEHRETDRDRSSSCRNTTSNFKSSGSTSKKYTDSSTEPSLLRTYGTYTNASSSRSFHKDRLPSISQRKLKAENCKDNVEEHRTKDYKMDSVKRHTRTPKEPLNVSHLKYNFKKYRQFLDKIFFSDRSCIKKDTEKYIDFWQFLDKYIMFQEKMEDQVSRKDGKPNESLSGTSSENLKIFPDYCKNFKINILLKNPNLDDFIEKAHLSDDSKIITHKAIVLEFRNIFLHYLDFCQKQKFSKLKKLKNDQKNLPISQYKETIIDHVKIHQVVIVAGDTGCGKSTQLPQYLLEAGFKNIACTQPRRIACISLSKRVSFETLNEYGSEVAYQIRFSKTKTRNTHILFLTEGLLLRQISNDIYLHQYDVVVLDEVHERHIYTDVLLGILKCLLKQREDLKVVLMSATINIDLFSSYFDNAPVVKVPGRLFPIQLEYHPISKEAPNETFSKIDPSPYLQIMQTIDFKYPSEYRGDLLIFLSGMTEILTIVEAAHEYAQQTKKWIILPLHSALSVDQQDKVFDIAPDGIRKCIVSTNIAETSVTIDGVRFIIDSGKVKEMNFDPKLKMQCLREFWISQASAEQRKGRAGRTGPGVCFRLYSEADYNAMDEYSTPEIQRVCLNSLILQMTALGLPDCRKFPFIEKPAGSALEDSIFYLKEQGTLNNAEKLTHIGEMLSKIPVDIMIGKMLIMGTIFHIIDPIISIAAALSVQSPFVSRNHTDFEVEALQKSFLSDHGDPFTLLNCFEEWIQVKTKRRETKKWCKKRGLLEQRFYEMTKLKKQYKDLLQDHGLLTNDDTVEKHFQTSEERRQYNSDRKRLYQLKREENKKAKIRKLLKFKEKDFPMRGESDDENENYECNDIKDLEFRLAHDLNKLQEVSTRSQCFTVHQINLLKIILCSGLYPQVAISDECNTFKPNSEQVFHTKRKGFLLLHPTSVFFSQPDLLQLPDNDMTEIAGHKGIMSSKHELLAYVSILETNKPYLINSVRVPAMETLLLFSNTVDTNRNCSRMVCDAWLELTFAHADEGEQVLISAIHLRSLWQNLITSRLQEKSHQCRQNSGMPDQSNSKLEHDLTEKLAEFINSKIVYSIRRIMTAELKHLYVGQLSEPNTQFQRMIKSNQINQHPIKGGIIVNDFLIYNCLQNNTSSMQQHWDTSFLTSFLKKLQHEATCEITSQESGSLQKEEINSSRHQFFFCTECQKEFLFTNTEILKHKRNHKNFQKV